MGHTIRTFSVRVNEHLASIKKGRNMFFFYICMILYVSYGLQVILYVLFFAYSRYVITILFPPFLDLRRILAPLLWCGCAFVHRGV